MNLQTFYGILILFLGTSLGSACVFLVKNGLLPQAGHRDGPADFPGLRRRRHDRRLRMESSDPVDGAVRFHGKAILPPGAYRFLDWRPLPPASGSCHP